MGLHVNRVRHKRHKADDAEPLYDLRRDNLITTTQLRAAEQFREDREHYLKRHIRSAVARTHTRPNGKFAFDLYSVDRYIDLQTHIIAAGINTIRILLGDTPDRLPPINNIRAALDILVRFYRL